jgi:hypothetical protein
MESINKSLLNEVLNKKFYKIEFAGFGTYTCSNTLICRYIKDDENYSEQINIYELAHKCKEWAFKQGYSLNVFNSNSNYHEVTPNTLAQNDEEWVEHPYSIASSEPEAVFKACQWILDNKDKQ